MERTTTEYTQSKQLQVRFEKALHRPGKRMVRAASFYALDVSCYFSHLS